MLTHEETRAVLAVAMGYDNRRPGDLNVAAWQMASDIGRWTLGEAINAVHEHYAVSKEFLMPADITQRIRAERRHAPMPAERQIESAPPAQPERINSLVAQLANRLGWQRVQTTQQDPELRHRCPHVHCQAGPGRPCGRRITRGAHLGEFQKITGYHASRTELANRGQEKAS